MKSTSSLRRFLNRVFIHCAPVLAASLLLPASAPGDTTGTPWTGKAGVTESVASIMAREHHAALQGARPPRIKPVLRPNRGGLPQNPNSPLAPAVQPRAKIESLGPFTPQVVSTNFTAATLADTGSLPPDTMGAVGPSQFVVAINGRIRTFNKTTGVADGALNVSMDTFFNSVMTPPTGSNFTSDPHVRYDRLSGRWIVIIIDVPGGGGALPNRVLFAVSSGATISNASSFTFFFFQHDLVTPAGDTNNFADYPTLGIDNNALYIGDNVFTSAGSFSGCSAFVVRKSSILGAGPIVVTAFRNLLTTSVDGPFTPQGVDNYDPAATEGYFIGVSGFNFGQLHVRRVSNPGGSPTISGNLSITVAATANPLAGPQLGSTATLDSLDDRLFAAHIRNGRLWTAHNIGVNSAGAATSPTRTATRWYELQNLTGTPSVVQSGTVFDSAASNPRFFTIPSILVSGQGHVAMGFSTTGASQHPNAATCGRLAADTLGTMQAPTLYTNSGTAYAPQGAGTVQRWGDYSYTSLDPEDDMTMWTLQEFCDANNSYGVRAAKLLAPPPATPSLCNPASVAAGQSNVNVVVTGTQLTGSGFFDPGAGFAKRIAGSIGGGVVVNSATFTSPTSVTLNITTTGASVGPKDVTVTNPDGQSLTGSGLLTITPGGGGGTTLTVGPNVNVSKRSGYEAEVAIGVNPTNPQNLFVLSNTDGSFMFGGVSNDGGTTWTTRNVATGADGIVQACCDPTVSFDEFGNLFMGYLDSGVTAVILTRSTNGGASFVPQASLTGSVDQPTVIAGGGAVWTTFNSSGNIVARGAQVTGLGAVGGFSAEQIAASSNGGNFGDVVIGPSGKMAVTYQNPSGGEGPSTIFAHVDPTGLAAGGFGSQLTVTSTNVGGFDFVPPQPNRSVDSEAGLAWDRTGGAHNNRLYMVYTDETVNENNDTNIMLRFSDNDGVTWSAPLRVNDDATTRTQMFPKIALDPTTGNIAIVWYDARNDSSNVKVELWGTVSMDGGQTFLPNVKISAGASDGRQNIIGNPNEFGDYIGLTFYNNAFYPAWADSSNSTGDNPNGTAGLDIYVAKVTVTTGGSGPSNDNFASAQTLSGGSGAVTGTNVGATKEVGEPNHAGNVGGTSVWYQWTAPADGVATFDTFTSAFDTLLAVYTGGAVNTLAEIGSNDDSGGGTQSSVTFNAVSGTVYHIAVDGFSGASGNIALHFTLVPANDNFANAQNLPGPSGSVTGTNVSATKESGEPNHAGDTGGASVWYQWTAPLTGSATFDTFTSNFDTVLAVYTGSAVNALTQVVSNDDFGGGAQSSVTFNAVGGTTYRIAVDGFGGATGNILLTYSLVPGNDNFANAQVLPGGAGTVTGFNENATKETGEPNHAGNTGGRSVWYRWTAPQSGPATFDTLTSNFDTLLAIYTGSAVNALTVVGSNDDSGGGLQSSVTFNAVAGTIYRIAVDGFGAETGNITLHYTSTITTPPPVVVTTAGSLAYTENQAATAIDSGVTVTDIDSTNLVGGSVAITGNFASGQDVLGFANQSGITGSYNAGTGALTLTGTASVAAYQAALRAVTYVNSSENPSILQRTATFTVSDGTLSGSNTRTINVTAQPDAPVVTTTAGSAAYSENQAPAVIDGGLGITDVDSANLVGGTVAITGNFVSGQDVLAFANQGGITGSYNTGTGALTLTGTASVAAYQAALRTVTYANSSDNPSTAQRTVTFAATDGALIGSNTRTINVTSVPDAPVVTTTGGSLTYAATTTAAAIDAGVTATDPDNANLTGATVAITGNFAGAQDVLAFANQGGITGSYNTGSGVLTLSGTAATAAYQTALRSVTYFNSSLTPSTALRTVTFTASDGGLSGSNTRTINVTNPPVFYTLTLKVSPLGAGTITPNPAPNGQGKYADGTVVTLTAGANTDFTFDSFSGDASGTTNPVQVTMNADKSVTAIFTPDPIVPVAGTYFGLVESGASRRGTSGFDNAGSGFLKLAVTATSRFTGTLKFAGQTVALRGSFGGQTGISGTIKIPRHGNITITLAGGRDLIVGSIADNGASSVIQTHRNVFNKRTNPAPQAGKYTLLTQPTAPFLNQSQIPQGFGSGRVTVKTSGTAKVVSKLSDGSNFSVGSGLSKFATMPLFSTAYKKLGSVQGTATLQSIANQSDCNGTLDWFKPPRSSDPLYPSGFTTQLNYLVSRFAAPARGQRVLTLPDSTSNLRITLAGGNVAPIAPFNITLDRNNRVIGNGGVGFKMSIKSKTGAFKGSFIDQSQTRKFTGSIFQKQNVGTGAFKGAAQTGAVLLESSSAPILPTDDSAAEPPPEP